MCNEIGFPLHTFVDGRSMGGYISTVLAEMPCVRTHYTGVMAIGAALINAAVPLRNRPGIPILYLTNVSEIGPIQAYIDAVRGEVERDRKRGIGAHPLRSLG